MERILNYIKESQVFFVATIENEQPRVRPFGIMLNIDGKLSIGTSNKKDVFKQIIINPNIEISAMGKNGSFIRISGNVKTNTTTETKNKFFEALPLLKEIYKEDENIFEVLSFEKAKVTFQEMNGNKETINL
jgi:uncharacterized pyridoxamine 5'-phosphate oxidase family protein